MNKIFIILILSLVGGIIGGTLTLLLHCMLIVAKESDYHNGRE